MRKARIASLSAWVGLIATAQLTAADSGMSGFAKSQNFTVLTPKQTTAQEANDYASEVLHTAEQLRSEIANLQEHLQRAQSLLEKGFAKEALGEFRHCISHDPIYAPAWEGAAAAHERLGDSEQAEQCRQRAGDIVRQLWDQRIEAEIRSQHMLWRKGLPKR